MNLPIPAEIVGDTETLSARYRQNTISAASLAHSVGSALAAGDELRPGGFFHRRLIAEWMTWDALLNELNRRSCARRLASAIQPEGVHVR